MSKVAIVTDSNAGISQEEGKELGIYILPMPFLIDGVEYFEDINLTQEEFYEKLEADVDVSTSQPSAGSILDLWDKIFNEDGYDEIVFIPMSSGLSGACETAMMLAEEYDGRVQVVNNQRISVTQRQSILDALELVKRGMNACEIKVFLEDTKMDSSIFIMVDTLKYLKKGGRVTPAGAALATILGIKPVLQINGGKLDAYAKARSVKIAKRTMIEGIINDIKTRFPEDYENNNFLLQVAYTYDKEAAEEFREEVKNMFPEIEPIVMNALSLSVSCHIGPGSLAVAYTRKVL
ncbi:MAG: DegV family protein [Lachnospiraceae bacterium]|nr:DegV family protein [Lachnospiraceae bacterium]